MPKISSSKKRIVHYIIQIGECDLYIQYICEEDVHILSPSTSTTHRIINDSFISHTTTNLCIRMIVEGFEKNVNEQ